MKFLCLTVIKFALYTSLCLCLPWFYLQNISCSCFLLLALLLLFIYTQLVYDGTAENIKTPGMMELVDYIKTIEKWLEPIFVDAGDVLKCWNSPCLSAELHLNRKSIFITLDKVTVSLLFGFMHFSTKQALCHLLQKFSVSSCKIRHLSQYFLSEIIMESS